MQHYKDILAEVLIDEETLHARIKELGAEISADYPDGNLLLICILRGGVPFLVHLSRHITAPHMMDFMAVSSYGVGKRESSGAVRVTFDLQTDIRDKDVLLVEDIIDSGLTLSYLIDVLERRNALSISVVALFNKPVRRTVELEPDYTGYVLPDEFVVGYGLDYSEKYRNLPFVGILKPEIYNR